jgi:hypothetical protein
VSLLADDLGTIVNIFLHFHGDLDVTPYPGPIPGAAARSPSGAACG